jgi:hypothetical protein
MPLDAWDRAAIDWFCLHPDQLVKPEDPVVALATREDLLPPFVD